MNGDQDKPLFKCGLWLASVILFYSCIPNHAIAKGRCELYLARGGVKRGSIEHRLATAQAQTLTDFLNSKIGEHLLTPKTLGLALDSYEYGAKSECIVVSNQDVSQGSICRASFAHEYGHILFEINFDRFLERKMGIPENSISRRRRLVKAAYLAKMKLIGLEVAREANEKIALYKARLDSVMLQISEIEKLIEEVNARSYKIPFLELLLYFRGDDRMVRYEELFADFVAVMDQGNKRAILESIQDGRSFVRSDGIISVEHPSVVHHYFDEVRLETGDWIDAYPAQDKFRAYFQILANALLQDLTAPSSQTKAELNRRLIERLRDHTKP